MGAVVVEFADSGRQAEVPMIFCAVGKYLSTLISTLGHAATLEILVAVRCPTGE